jgi:hypothetical protein
MCADERHDARALSPAAAPTPPSECVNCGTVFSGQYCSMCGQRRFAGRHTIRSIVGSIVGRFASLEKGFVHTALQLTTRPGAVIRGYWAGRTTQYTHPAGYLLVAVAAFALIWQLFGDPIGAADGDRTLMLLIIPFVAAASRVLLWRARKNYAEHLIAVMYLAGHIALVLGVLSIGVSFMSGPALTTYAVAALTLSCGYFLWGYSAAFPSRPVLAAFAALGSLVLGAAGWLVAMMRLVRWFGGQA